MFCKISLLLFCVALLSQGDDAATLRERRDTAATTRRAAQISLIKFFVKEMDKLGRIKLESSKKIAESVLNDPQVIEVKNDVMESYLQDFRQFVEHWKNYSGKNLTLVISGDKIMSEESALFKKYLNNTNETKEAVIISNVLKEHGAENQLQLLNKPLMEFSNKFIPEAENYLKILDETKADEVEKAYFEDLIKRLKAETNVKKHGDLILIYISSFEVELEDIL